MTAKTSKLEKYRLETRFYGDYVVHTTYTSDPSAQTREREVVKSKWTELKKIGMGGHGSVWLQSDGGGQLRAVKKLPRDFLSARNIDFSRELLNLAEVKDHQDLFVEFLGWYENRDFVFFAMEYIEYGDLGQYLKELGSEARLEAKRITRQILEGLVVLHEREICHRDLKPQVWSQLPTFCQFKILGLALRRPQNVLIVSTSPMWVKIADFGVSKCAADTHLQTRHGTQGYIAPELLGLLPRKSRMENSYSNAVDVWSLGCLLHKILTLQTPFLESSPETIYSDPLDSSLNIPLSTDIHLLSGFCSGKIDFPTEILQASGVSNETIIFIKSLLVADPNSRLSAKDALESAWFFDESAEDLRSQFSILGLELTPETINSLIAHTRKGQSWNIYHIKQHLPPLVRLNIGAFLHKAALNGYTQILETILYISKEVDLRIRGRTLLQTAAEGGHTEAVKLLLRRKADVNAEPAWRKGRTALQAAAGGGNLDMVKLLLDRKADINAGPAPFGGRTALQAAAGGGYFNIVELLLCKKADLNAEPAPFEGQTALQAAAGGGYLDVVRLLLDKGAEVNTKPASTKGRTALQAAAEAGHLEVVKLLLGRNADLNAEPASFEGRTALQAAAGGGYPDVARLLLDKEADVNTKPASVKGRTALQAAAEAGNLDIVKLLLDRKANVNAEPAWRKGRTALQAAAGGGHLYIVELLLDRKADINAEPAPMNGRTALQTAAGGGHLDIVKLLFDRGADINAEPAMTKGRTTLQAAAEAGHLDVVKLLLEYKANINAKPASTNGRTALQAAAGGGHLDTVKLLLEGKADINAEPAMTKGRTTLEAAAEAGHLDVLNILLEIKAGINAEPAAVVEAEHYLDMAKLVLKRKANIDNERHLDDWLIPSLSENTP